MYMKNSYLYLIFSVLLPSLAFASPTITEFTLPNKMQVVLIEDHRVPAISHNLLFRIGAADDPRGESGLAHYLEHMLFQGTTHYAPNAYSHLLSQRGGQSNAFTTADYTGYWANISKEGLPLVMKLEADRLQNLAPQQKDFDKEKQVILEERRMRVENDPNALFDEQMNALLYYHHPYGTPIIGWAKEMAGLNRKTVMQYYRDYYHPANAVLVLAGDFDTKTMRRKVTEVYGAIPARKAKPAMRLQEPPQLGARRFTMRHAQVKQREWQKSYLVPGYHWRHAKKGQNIVPLLLAEHVLGGGQTSRLYRRLVEKDKLATAVAIYYYPYVKGPAEFSIYVTPAESAEISAIEAAVQEEILALIQQPVTEEEVERIKTQKIASNVYVQDGLQSLAKVMGHLKMLEMPLDYYEKWPANVQAVTPAQIQKSLKVLDENYSVTGVLMPSSGANAKP